MSKKLTVGSDNVTSLYVGTQKVKKIYAGSELVYESTPPLPTKGDIIQIVDNGNTHRFRVLKVQGNVFKLLAMTSFNVSINSSSDDAYYFGGVCDTQLNTTYYNTFSSAFKNAIVPQVVNQTIVAYSNTAQTGDYCYKLNNGSPQYFRSIGTFSSDTRNIYLISLEDLIEYYEATTSMNIDNTTLTNTNFSSIGSVARFSFINKTDTATETIISIGPLQGELFGSQTNTPRNSIPILNLDVTNIPYTIE